MDGKFQLNHQDAILDAYFGVECLVKNGLVLFENTSYNNLLYAGSSVSFEFHISTIEHYFSPSDIIIDGSENILPDKPEDIKKLKLIWTEMVVGNQMVNILVNIR